MTRDQLRFAFRSAFSASALAAVALVLHARAPTRDARYFAPQPYVETGGFYASRGLCGADLPENVGYRERDGWLLWEPGLECETTVAGRFSPWLFRGRQGPEGSVTIGSVYVLGGSVAYGIAATPGHSWWEILERETGRHFVPAAMGSWNVTQERVALELAVLPRRPSLVIVLDGNNDLALGAEDGARPGDPWAWAARQSTSRDERGLRRAVEARNLEILASPHKLDAFARQVAGCYRDGISRLLARCREAGVPAFAFLQPTRAVTRARLGPSWTDTDGNTRAYYNSTWHDATTGDALTVAGYARYIAEKPAEVIDITGTLDALPECYVDECHPDDRGHAAIARAILPYLQRP